MNCILIGILITFGFLLFLFLFSFGIIFIEDTKIIKGTILIMLSLILVTGASMIFDDNFTRCNVEEKKL